LDDRPSHDLAGGKRSSDRAQRAADLPKAIDTILAQTFTDFELIVVNDGSTDGTVAVLDAIRDPRLRVVHQDNVGLGRALNRGIALARGCYIARQDHDDWAKPTRLEKEVAFMEANPECALVGTCADGPSKSSLEPRRSHGQIARVSKADASP
jgi:glycosyltransferase involved in cell wall biosynthesis